jgi:hypothetical protein
LYFTETPLSPHKSGDPCDCLISRDPSFTAIRPISQFGLLVQRGQAIQDLPKRWRHFVVSKDLPRDGLGDRDPGFKAGISDVEIASDAVVELVDGITKVADVELADVPFLELRFERGEGDTQLPLVRDPGESSQLLALCFPKESLSATAPSVAAERIAAQARLGSAGLELARRTRN